MTDLTAFLWNPSPRKLQASLARLCAATGWFCMANEEKVSSIAPYSSREIEFAVAAPSICSKRALRPIVLKYESDKATSTPATEMVWWTGAQP